MASINRNHAALIALRLFLGVFFVFEGWDKRGWLFDPSPLTTSLQNWSRTSVPISHWYLEHVAIPGVPVFARLVFLGEVAAGVALILGAWTRVTAITAFLMVL